MDAKEEMVFQWSFPLWFVVATQFISSSAKGFGFEYSPNQTSRGLSMPLFMEMVFLWLTTLQKQISHKLKWHIFLNIQLVTINAV